MLILTRKVGETIRIGDGVTVRVLEVRGSQVRLGIDAPADVRIFREEIYEATRDGTGALLRAAEGPPANGEVRSKPPVA